MNEEFGVRLKNCLKEAGYTQARATEILNLSKNAILNYTKGRIPEANILYELAKLCNVSMEYLITGKKDIKELSNDDFKLLEKYHLLSNENKIKTKVYIDIRLEEQQKNNIKIDGMNLA